MLSLLYFLNHYDNRKFRIVQPRKKRTLHSALKDDYRPLDPDNSVQHSVIIRHEHNRRVILATLLTTTASTMMYPTVSCALNDNDDNVEFDNMNIVTRQIRKSVVRGAQLIDIVDGAWERFSDDYGLGSKRNLPKRNVIDAGGNAVTKKFVMSSKLPIVNFDETFAYDILRLCDDAFLQCLTYQQSQQTISMNKVELNQQIDQLKQYLRKSFFSSSNDNHAPPSMEEEYNFDCYSHFRVYNEILIKRNINFAPFYKAYERMVGTSILQFAMLAQQQQSSSSSLAQSLNNALSLTDDIATLLQTKGLIASWERSIPLDDTIEDFVNNNNEDSTIMSTTDLTYSLALNGDITLNSQLLLQELGYRLYPSFGRWMVNEALLQCFMMSHSLPAVGNNGDFVTGSDSSSSSASSSAAKIIVYIDDYYMDTSYNSNPDLFEVKQILLNIVIQQD
jgi:hypothetical protein